jgi:hypothetical protein
VAKWDRKKRLTISANKSEVTLFTPNNRELNVKSQIRFQGSLIPVENLINILGLNWDSLHSFNPLEKISASNGRSGHHIIKGVQGSDFRLSNKDGLMAYKALVVPRLGYAGPLWMPVRNSLKHQVLNLQLVQNAALRTITGCHAAASKQHLHNECSILPIHKHVSMQCRQFLANTRQRHHPSSEVISLPPGRRPNRKPILQHSFGSEVKRFETDGAIPQITFTRAVKSLHMEAVAAALSSAGPNRVLGARPPVVDPSEATGTTLSQLWSDFCKHLRSYKHFINNTTDDSCLNCQTAPHREKKKKSSPA